MIRVDADAQGLIGQLHIGYPALGGRRKNGRIALARLGVDLLKQDVPIRTRAFARDGVEQVGR